MRDSKVADKQPEQKKLRKPAYEKKNPRAHAEWLGRKHERNAAKGKAIDSYIYDSYDGGGGGFE